MTIVDSIIKLLSKKADPKTAPDGICPNCWGRQEYGGHFYEAIKKQTFNIEKMEDNARGWIEDYVDKNLSDIKVHPQGDGVVCDKCRISYSKEK